MFLGRSPGRWPRTSRAIVRDRARTRADTVAKGTRRMCKGARAVVPGPKLSNEHAARERECPARQPRLRPPTFPHNTRTPLSPFNTTESVPSCYLCPPTPTPPWLLSLSFTLQSPGASLFLAVELTLRDRDHHPPYLRRNTHRSLVTQP